MSEGFTLRARTGDHKQGWAIVDLHNGTVKTCSDEFTRETIMRDMVQAGVPLTKIHALKFTEHRRPEYRVCLSAPMTGWI